MKPLLLILALAIGVQCQSVKEGDKITEWTLMGESDLAKIYYAPESIQRGNGLVRVWVKVDLPQGSDAVDYKLKAGRDFGSIRGYGVLNCNDSTAHTGPALVLYYDRAGRLVKTVKEKENVRDNGQDNGLAAVFAYFCERGASIPSAPPKLKPKP